MKFTGTEEWHVQVGPNNVKVMSLEQIDDALRLKLIHQRTNVWTDGMGPWRSLGDVFAEVSQEPDHQTHPRQAAPTRVGGFQAHAAPPTATAARGALPTPLVQTTARPGQSAAPAAARPGPAPLVASRAPAPLVQSAPPQRGSFAPAALVSAAPVQAAPPPPPFNVAAVARVAEPIAEVEEVDDAEEDDKWHVQISPTEVKVMTLDQLDDAFRLDIVTAQTKIWQEGLDEWLTLGEVAGLDEDDTAVPPAPAPVASRPPGPAPLVASARPGPAPLVQSVPPGSVRPGPAPLVSAAHGSGRPGPAPLASMPPGSVRPGPAPLASVPPGAMRPGPAPLQPAIPRSLTSVPPLAMEVPRAPQPKLPNQTFVRTLMWASAIAACFAGLHRNGGSFALAQATGKTAAYDSAVKALGGPGVSTPVEMGRRITEARDKYHLGDLSPTKPVGENAPKSSFEESEKEEGEEGETEAVPTTPQKSPSRGNSSAAPAARAETGPVGLGGGKGKKKKGKQDHFDPLNAELP